MFEKIYSDVSNELLRNNITDTNIAVSMYRNKIVDMVANYFPMYDRNLGGPQQIIEVIARQVGNKDEMEKFLDENVPKWRNYLNDRQFLSAVAISMANKYFNSKNNSYGNYENQSSEEQVYNVLLNKIRNASDNPLWFDGARAMKIVTNVISHKIKAKYIIPTKINMEDGIKDMLYKQK